MTMRFRIPSALFLILALAAPARAATFVPQCRVGGVLVQCTGQLAQSSGGTGLDLSSVTAGYVLAGPCTGPAASATLRALCAAEMPSGIDATKIGGGTVTNTILSYLDATSSIQTQLNGKQASGAAAGGDLSGNYPNPTVSKINGNSLGTTTATSGNILIGSGSAWATQAVSGDATLTSAGVLTLGNTGVSATSYPASGQIPTFTVDAKGRLTIASSTTSGSALTALNASNISSGTLAEARGGFGTDASAIGTGLLARTGAAAYSPRTLTGPAAGITVSNGSGVSGNPTLALANDMAALEGLSSTGIAVRTASDTWAQRSIAAGTGTTVTNGDGVSGNMSVNVTYGTSSSTATQGNDARLNPTPSTAGKIPYDNGSAYAAITNGTTSQVLVGGSAPAFGTVPAAAITALTGTITGTYTLGGTPTIPTSGLSGTVSRTNGGLGSDVSGLSTGLLAQTASNTWAVRSVAAGTGVSISNGDGVSGNPTISLPNTGPGSGANSNVNGITLDAQGRVTAVSKTTNQLAALMHANNTDAITANSTKYLRTGTLLASGDAVLMVTNVNKTVNNLACFINVTVSGNVAFTVRKYCATGAGGCSTGNWADTSVVASGTSLGTGARIIFDTTHTASFANGDLVSISVAATNSLQANDLACTWEVVPQ